MWRCLKCGEESVDVFSICWNCQTEKGENSPRPPNITQPKPIGDELPKPRTVAPPKAISSSFLQSPSNPAISRIESALLSRYKDAYLVAKITDGLGNTIKITGFILAGIILLGTFAFANFATNQRGMSSDISGGVSIVTLIIGGGNAFVVGFVFYIIGVVVSAQGQVLKATLDNTVGNSPFLENNLKAKIMSLPEA